jgi:hypothetical protein
MTATQRALGIAIVPKGAEVLSLTGRPLGRLYPELLFFVFVKRYSIAFAVLNFSDIT